MDFRTALRRRNLGFHLLLRCLSAASAVATASPSAILIPSNPSAILTAKQKSRAALSLQHRRRQRRRLPHSGHPPRPLRPILCHLQALFLPLLLRHPFPCRRPLSLVERP
ncbi:hypothetical protein AXF42_Ash010989 [Apostasia shenzhenica]|uniref:Uncharacterized protein n=1 Tax=Apostasia shenzhenica TaxID=1088818 RepID=A0A2H9ZQT5_9ASPA|nr:hypothetical protein AXF42_Ash010989 [Apostasia shenzhenica]